MSEYLHQHPLALIPPAKKSLNDKSIPLSDEDIRSTETKAIIRQMLALAQGIQVDKSKPTMVGLAASQLGVNKRIIIVDVTATGKGEEPTFKVFINPVITRRSSKIEQGREGCFSTGNVCGIVERASKITLEAQDELGQKIRKSFSGFTARIFQHEVDHLDGFRFPDRITDNTKLHWVKPEEFGEYREQWQHWQELCPRERWLDIKSGRYPL
jgi:peptide deformylase